MYIVFTRIKDLINKIKKNQKTLELRPKFLLNFIQFDKKNGKLLEFANSYYTHILLVLLSSKRLIVIITQNENYFLAILLSNLLVIFFFFFLILRFFIITNVICNIKTIINNSIDKSNINRKRSVLLALLIAFSVSIIPEETELMRKAAEKVGTTAVKVLAADEAVKRTTG
jgi:hypothetical protein